MLALCLTTDRLVVCVSRNSLSSTNFGKITKEYPANALPGNLLFLDWLKGAIFRMAIGNTARVPAIHICYRLTYNNFLFLPRGSYSDIRNNKHKFGQEILPAKREGFCHPVDP